MNTGASRLVSQSLGMTMPGMDQETEEDRRRKALEAARQAGQGPVSSMFGQMTPYGASR